MSAAAGTNGAPLSKRARKRLAKAEAFREKKRLKKEAKREARRARASAASATNAESSSDAAPNQPPSEFKLARAAREAARRATFLETCARGPRIVFDMDFEDLLTLKEKKSMSQQIMYCYGANKRADVPVAMHLAGLRGDTECMLNKIHGFPNRWLGLTVSTKPYHLDSGLFPDMSKIVYLTADSTNVLDDFMPGTSYVIGGIVDRNRLKNATKDKADSQGVRTARLPIQEFCNLNGSKVLAINHVFEIVLAKIGAGMFRNCSGNSTGDGKANTWPHALIKGIPSRKDLVLKPEFRDSVGPAIGDSSNIGASSSAAGPASTVKLSLSSSSSSSSSALSLTLEDAPPSCPSSQNPLAVVIGGSSGIGRAFARTLYLRGFDVLIVARSIKNLRAATAHCMEQEVDDAKEVSNSVSWFPADCSSASSCDKLVSHIRGNKISLLVNCAGDFRWDSATSESLPKGVHSVSQHLFRSNLATKRTACKLLMPLMAAPPALNGTRSSIGAIVIVGSAAGAPGFKDAVEAREGEGAVDDEKAYIACMTQVRLFAERLRSGEVPRKRQKKKKELAAPVTSNAGTNRRIVLLEPGLVNTEMARREFSKLGIDWAKIPTPNAYVESVIHECIE